jgi:dienelactone hydrolase
MDRCGLPEESKVNRPSLILVAALSLCPAPLFADAHPSGFEFLQPPGPYAVGLQVVDQYDPSRNFPSPRDVAKPSATDNERPLQTLVWYPAAANAGHPMTVGDYVRLADTELDFSAPHPERNRWRSLLQASFDAPLRAVRDVAPASGRYPVLIYATSDSSVSWENADLCEYLASHGYVVVASPSLGVSTRDMTDDGAGIDAQARDISFLVGFTRSLADADLSQVAVISWSWGGLASLFAAARDPRIDALVSMDGTMRYYPGLVTRAGDVHPERMTIPLLFFAQNVSLEDRARDDAPLADKLGPNVLNEWQHGDLLMVNMLGMSHPEFSSMFQRRQNASQFAQNQIADFGRDDANTGYAWVALYTLKFLDAYLKHDASAKAFLVRTPAENGVPRHFMGITMQPGR